MKKPKKNTRNYHKSVQKFSEGGAVEGDGSETAYQVNVGPKSPKGGYAKAYPNTDDNMFFADSDRDEKIIRAKRTLKARAAYGDNGYNTKDAGRETQSASDRFRGK